MPFAGYTDFDECTSQNRDKDDPDAYCGSIKHKVEDKMKKHYLDNAHGHPHGKDDYFGSTAEKLRKTVDSSSYLHQSVRRALTLVAKGHDPVKEEGKKKLTENEGTSAEGAQDDQAFAVAFGPDNYDKLTKTIIAAPYQQAYNAAGTILKALENKQFNFPGNIEEHMKKAHAAIHGREMWDARYSDVCDLITQARKILHSIEKTAEVSEGGSGMMVVGKADPGQSEQKAGRGMGVSGAGGVAKPGWAKTEQRIPGGGSREHTFPAGKPPARPKPKAGVGNLPHSGFPHRGAAHKAVQKAIKAVRGE